MGPDHPQEPAGLVPVRPAGSVPPASGEQRPDPRPPAERGGTRLLLPQLVQQDLLPVIGDRRQPAPDLVAQDGAGGHVGRADQQGRVQPDQHPHEQRQLPDDRLGHLPQWSVVSCSCSEGRRAASYRLSGNSVIRRSVQP